VNAGVRVGVITNSWGTAPYDPYAAYQLDQQFDAVVISSQVGLRKPEPAVYRRAADELVVPLGRIMFVDDIVANLQQLMSWAWPSSIMSIQPERFASWSACLASQLASCAGHDGC
jgi:FMN phosphatase YigB (HAD superfamily)